MSKFIASNLFSFNSEYFCFDCLPEECKVLDSDLNASIISSVRVLSLNFVMKNDSTCSVCDCEGQESEQQSEDKQERKKDKDIVKALNLDAVRIETSNVMPKALLEQESADIETTEVNAIEHLKLGKKQIALLQSDPSEFNAVESLKLGKKQIELLNSDPTMLNADMLQEYEKLKQLCSVAEKQNQQEYNELKQLIALTEEKLALKAKNKEVESLQKQITSDLSGRKSMQKEITIPVNVTEKQVFVNGILGVKIINNNKVARRSAASLFDI